MNTHDDYRWLLRKMRTWGIPITKRMERVICLSAHSRMPAQKRAAAEATAATHN